MARRAQVMAASALLILALGNAASRMLPDVVLRAARLIRAGEVTEVGYPLDSADVPLAVEA